MKNVLCPLDEECSMSILTVEARKHFFHLIFECPPDEECSMPIFNFEVRQHFFNLFSCVSTRWMFYADLYLVGQKTLFFHLIFLCPLDEECSMLILTLEVRKHCSFIWFSFLCPLDKECSMPIFTLEVRKHYFHLNFLCVQYMKNVLCRPFTSEVRKHDSLILFSCVH